MKGGPPNCLKSFIQPPQNYSLIWIFFFFKSQNIFTSPEIKETEIPRNRRKIKMMRKTKGKRKKGDLRTNTRQ